MVFQPIPNRRIICWVLLALVLAGFMLSLAPQRLGAAAPSVTFIGADTTTNDAWRTTSVAKPLDIDGDNIYGSDGFYLYSGGTHTLTAPPPYATVVPRPGMTVFSGNPSYIFYDNPDLTGAGPIPNVLTGVIYDTNNPTEWVDITFTQPGLFRVGIITDNADFIPISPLNFRFQQMVGGTVDTGYIAASADRDQDIDYYLFDVEANAGDVYRLSGQNDPGNTWNGIAAIFFDGIPALTITDTTAGTATNDGTVNVSEYVGFSTGINNGFGNVIGSASQLHIDSDGSGNLNLGLKAGTAILGTDAMVVYIDTDNGGTGFSTTSGFTDTGGGIDNCRKAISGFDGTNRSTLNFAPGFTANYAICLDSISSGFAGLWQLTNSGSHTFITSLNRTNTGTDYEMNFSLANLGLSAGSQFRYVATYLNGSNAFRSNEFHGVAIFAGGNPGYAPVNLTSNSFIVFEAVDTTLVVDRADDTNAAAARVCDDALPTDCSIRGAISKANADTTGAYTILFDPSLNGTPLTLSLAGTGEDANTTGDLDVTDDLTITGNGARNTIVNANGLDRVFDVPSGGIIVTLNDMTIQNGNASDGDGGGIYNAGTLTINRSTISSNSVTFVSNNGGGGIFNIGTMTINHSTVHNNIANGGSFDSGGGLFNTFTGIVNINNSTFSLNTAGLIGGAIFDEGTTVTIRNSTFSDNASLISFTGGIETDGTVNIQNSIITSSAGDDCGDNFGVGSFTGSNNLIDDFALPACNGISAAAVTNFASALQDNGGPTDTHALLAGSNALNTGTGNCPDHTATPLATDQRGITRPQNLTCDIGAYELVTAVTPGVNGGDGPGGVGTTDGNSPLEAWFRADRGAEEANNDPAETGDDVEFWRDQSGNNVHVSQAILSRRPNWITAALNGQPALANTGGTNGDVLTATLAAFAGDQPYMIFSAFNPANNNGENLFAIGSPNFFETIAYHPNLSDNRWYYHFGDDMLVTPLLSGWQLASFRYQALGAGTDRFYYANGSLAGSNAANPLTLAANPLLSVGGFDNRGGLEGQELTGQLGELIIFSTSLVEVERILVENYLSSKYNLAIPGADDHYDGDTPPGEFDLDVAGIGQLGVNQHTQAHSAGMIVVNGTFLSENGDWLLFGHNILNNMNTTTNVPTSGDWDGINDVRWARHWYVDVTDPSVNNGRVDIIFDFSEAGMNGGLPPNGPVSNYRLLRRAGASGQFSDITTLSGATVVIAGDQVQFLGVDVAQLGSNFTLGSIDGAAAPTAITTQNLASQTSQPTYLTLLVLLLLLLAGTIAVVWRRIV